MRFVLLIGVVSLFADMSYEGARSITGPFLAFLGASAFVTGVVAGVGEFVGYALRIVFGYLDHLQNQYRRLRSYAPALLEAFDFEAAPPAERMLKAIGVLREMNEKGKRKVPDDAPTDFVKPRWERHVFSEDGIDKPLYEIGAMNELNNALRSGDVWVPGSRRYADSEDYLLPRERWKDIRNNGGPPVAINPDLDEYLAQRSEELHRELITVNRMISRGKLQNARIEDGELRFSREDLHPQRHERLSKGDVGW